MDFSKLSANEKMATYAAVVLVLAGIISNWGGLVWLSVLAGAAILVVLFLPQMSAGTSLPGSRGTLLVTLGGIAAAGMVIELLRFLNYFFRTLGNWQTLLFAVGVIAALVLVWIGWQEFQAEGGTFKFGSSSTPSGTAPSEPAAPAAAAPPPAAPAAPPVAPAAPAAPAAEPMASAPASSMPASETADEEEDTTA